MGKEGSASAKGVENRQITRDKERLKDRHSLGYSLTAVTCRPVVDTGCHDLCFILFKKVMASIRNNLLTKGFSGVIGDIMFRQIGNNTFASKAPRAPKKQSALQRENRMKFKDASLHATILLLDPQKKAYYQQKAKKLKLPNAYTAAVTEYMRKGEIKQVDTKSYNAKAGSTIRIRTHKMGFGVNEVKVVFKDKEGNVLHKGEAVKKGDDHFVFILKDDLPDHIHHSINVIIADFNLKEVVRQVVVAP